MSTSEPLVPASGPKEHQSEPYFVEVDTNGCHHCGANRTYTVVGPDGAACGTSWGDDADADDYADAMNRAYSVGASVGASAAAPETAAERDRLREVNAELVKALEAIVALLKAGVQP